MLEYNFEDKYFCDSSRSFTPCCSLLGLQLVIPKWFLFTLVQDLPAIPYDSLGQQGVPQKLYQWVILSY